MAGHNVVLLQFLRPPEQLPELNISVAVDARIRRQSVFIKPDKALDHFFLKSIGKIKNIMPDPDHTRDAFRVLNVVQAAAASFIIRLHNSVVIQFHCNTGCFITGFLYQIRSHTAVYPAAHRGKHPLSSAAHRGTHILRSAAHRGVNSLCHRIPPLFWSVKNNYIIVFRIYVAHRQKNTTGAPMFRPRCARGRPDPQAPRPKLSKTDTGCIFAAARIHCL